MLSESSMLSPSRSVTLFGKKIAVLDLAAAAVFVLLFGWFCSMIRFGVNALDEGEYFSVARRFLQGDRPLVDEWHVSQFSALLQLLPFWAYTSLTGGTEGIILYFRWLYVCITAVIYWFLYYHYRRFGWAGLLGTALFCAFAPGDMFTLFYYPMAMQGTAVICTLLFVSQRPPKPPGYVFIGIVLACIVLAQPVFCVLYFVYCIMALIQKLSSRSRFGSVAYVFEVRSWCFLTLGVVITAIPVVLYLLLKSGLGNIVSMIPALLSDPMYDMSAEHVYNLFWKNVLLARYFGYANAVIGLLITAAAIVAALLKKRGFGETPPAVPARAKNGKSPKKNTAQEKARKFETARRVLFLLACLFCTLGYIRGIVSFRQNMLDTDTHQMYLYYFYHTAPISLLGLVSFVLSEKKNGRLFAVWMTVLIESAFLLYTSLVGCSILGVVAFPVSLIFTARLAKELFSSNGAPRKAKAGSVLLKGVPVMLALCICAFCCFEGLGLYVARFFQPTEKYESGMEELPLDHKLEAGPLKGIVTNAEIGRIYDAVLRDAERLDADGAGPVFTMGNYPYFYLICQRPMGTYSSWYVEEDTPERQRLYQELFPEKRPGSIFIPFYDFSTFRPISASDDPDAAIPAEEKLKRLSALCRYTCTEGLAGYLVQVEEWY